MLIKESNTIRKYGSDCLTFDNTTRPVPPTLDLVRNGNSRHYTSNNIYWFPLKIEVMYHSSSYGDADFDYLYFDFSTGAYKTTGDNPIVCQVSTNAEDGKHYYIFDVYKWWAYGTPDIDGHCWIQIVPCMVGEPELILTSSTQATTLTLFEPAIEYTTQYAKNFGASYGAAGYMEISFDDNPIVNATDFTTTGSSPTLQWGGTEQLGDASVFEAIIINTNVWNFSAGDLILRSNSSTLLGSSSTTLLKTTHSVSSTSVPSPALKYKGYLIPIYAIDTNDVVQTWWDRSGFHRTNSVVWSTGYVEDSATILSQSVGWKRLFCAYTNNLSDWN